MSWAYLPEIFEHKVLSFPIFLLVLCGNLYRGTDTTNLCLVGLYIDLHHQLNMMKALVAHFSAPISTLMKNQNSIPNIQ